MMKKSLLLSASLVLAMGASAQLPDGTIVDNFTANDIDGNSHTLYDYLDQGYTVIIDVMATWCGPCWNYQQTGQLETLYATYGPGTTDDRVMVLMVEGQGTNTTAQLYGPQALTGNYATATYGDWTAGIDYPIIDNVSIAQNTLDISYFPTIYMVCPNRQIFEVGQQSSANLWAAVQTCGAATAGNNAAVMNVFDGESIVCGATDLDVNIQNMGTSNLTSCTVAIKEGSTTLATQNWSGNLNTYDFDVVSFTGVNITNAPAVRFEITSSDANSADNIYNPDLIQANEALANITFNLTLDWFCSETTWKLFNSMGTIVQQGGPYNCTANTGGGADANSTKTFNWTLPMDCYKLEVYDSYGDGMNSMSYNPPHPNGYFEVKDGSGALLVNLAPADADFGDETKGGWEVNAAASIGENMLASSLSLFPNPSNGNVTLGFELPASSRVTIEVVNALGERMMAENINLPAGLQVIPMDLNHLSNGLYFFNITAGDLQTTRKVTLNK